MRNIVTTLMEYKHNLVTNRQEIDLICNTYCEENSVLIQIINELQKIKWLREAQYQARYFKYN